MTVFLSLVWRRLVLPLFFLALVAAALPARAADEPDSGGTFTTPSYPPRGTTQNNNPSLPQGTGSTQQPGATASVSAEVRSERGPQRAVKMHGRIL